MEQRSEGLTLTGLERWFVFNRLRAAIGVNWELPWLLRDINIPPQSLCLDVGTGLGWGTLGLLRLSTSTKVIGLDYDFSILPPARTYLGDHEADSRVAFCQADAKRLPFADGTFDFILSLYALHHCLGYSEALGEISRVLKPAARFAFIDLVHARFLPRLNHHGTRIPDRSEFTRLLADASLELERWRWWAPPPKAMVVVRKQPSPARA